MIIIMIIIMIYNVYKQELQTAMFDCQRVKPMTVGSPYVLGKICTLFLPVVVDHDFPVSRPMIMLLTIYLPPLIYHWWLTYPSEKYESQLG